MPKSIFRLQSLLIFLINTLAVFVPLHSFSWAYDIYPAPFEQIVMDKVDDLDLSRSIVHVRTTGSAIGFASDDIFGQKAMQIHGETETQGTGFYIGSGIIITTAHVAVPNSVMVRVSKNSYWEVPIWRLLTNTIIVSDYVCDLVWSDKEIDIAILKVKDETARNFFKALPYKIKGGEGIFEGCALAVITNMRTQEGEIASWKQEIRYGTVKCHYAIAYPHMVQWFNTDDITMNLYIKRGDSGSPIFAFEDGIPVIVAVARAKLPAESYSYAVRLNPIMPFLNNYFNWE